MKIMQKCPNSKSKKTNSSTEKKQKTTTKQCLNCRRVADRVEPYQLFSQPA